MMQSTAVYVAVAARRYSLDTVTTYKMFQHVMSSCSMVRDTHITQSTAVASGRIVGKTDWVQLHRASTAPANRACHQVTAPLRFSQLCRVLKFEVVPKTFILYAGNERFCDGEQQ